MKVIMFGTQKGGAAKSSSAVCTACILNALGHKTLFIDGDSQCNGSTLFKAESYGDGHMSLLDVVYFKRANRKISFDMIIQHCEGSDVITGDASIENNGDAISKMIDMCSDSLKYRIFEDIRNLNEYEYVVIDTAPTKSSLLTELLAITDYIIFPIADAGCIDGAHVVYSIASDVEKHTGKKINVAGFLMTIALPTENNFKDLYSDTVATANLSKFNSHVFNTIIRRRADFKDEIRKNNIPVLTCRESDASKDYYHFVKELLKQIGE